MVACRVSPDQKRAIVHMVTAHDPQCRALSIGDGANDVPMIQEAHVGVGIAGMEGMQAVNSSDFAIAQFRFLAPLLLAHGMYTYSLTHACWCVDGEGGSLESFFHRALSSLICILYQSNRPNPPYH